MQKILSAKNDKLKSIKKLLDKKYRDLEGKYIIEGARILSEAQNAGVNISTIVAAEQSYSDFAYLEQLGYNIYVVDNQIFTLLSDTMTPQGVLAVVKKPEETLAPPKGHCLVLDHISDPGNLGTIIRTAAAAGIEDIYLIGCADPYGPKAVRASMGGLFYVRAHQCGYDYLETIRRYVKLVGADMGGINYAQYPVKGLYHGLVVGSEAHGISEEARKFCKQFLAVPMKKVESLNAAVSAGILIYYLTNIGGGPFVRT